MRVGVVIGSESDKELGDEVIKVLEEFGVEYEYVMASAHRAPEELDRYLRESDVDVYIAIAGLSAALPGFIASKTTKPVIGLPRSAAMMGLDALISMVQMPPGVPVAVVGVDNARNAAMLALRILSLSDPELRKKLEEFREEMSKKSFSKLRNRR